MSDRARASGRPGPRSGPGPVERALTRRELVQGGLALAGAVGLGGLAAACSGQTSEGGPGAAAPPAEALGPVTVLETETVPRFTGSLRVMGLGVDLTDSVRRAGEGALGFELSFDVTDSVTMIQKALTQPWVFDVFAGYSYQVEPVWPSGNFHPLEIERLGFWQTLDPLVYAGKVGGAGGADGCSYGDGDAPFRMLYVDPERTGRWPSARDLVPELEGTIVQWYDEATGQPVGPEPSHVVGAPGAIFNVDALGYNAGVIQLEPEEVSWGELFNPEYRGRVALLNDPGIGLQDAGNAAKALGLMEFGNLGDMTKDEIDGLVTILLKLKRKKHFRTFWTDVNESVNLMASGDVVIQSMWSPAVAFLVAKGYDVRYAAPPEGYRGWCGSLMISKEAEKDPSLLEACYAYVNWWFSGEPGAIMMRQGYYNAVQGTSRPYVSPEEWDYWIEGLPAAEDLPGATGQRGDIRRGAVRDGGSYRRRVCRFSSWNSYFREQEHQIRRWNDLLSA